MNRQEQVTALTTEPLRSDVEAQIVGEQPQTVSVSEAVGSAVMTAANVSNDTKIVALDIQAPRSWDLHKSGW